jgi:predicted Holliday junction resolvase-like endonuclease
MDVIALLPLALLLIAAVAIIVLVYRYASLKSRLPLMIQEQCEQWKRGAEFELQRRVQARLQEWRDKEMQTVLSNARRDSLVHAQKLFRDWCENELVKMREEQRELARREASNHLTEWKQKREKVIRQDAVQRSQAVTTGKITEHLVPHLPNFNYNPKDARFVGSPVDFVVFDGLNDEEANQIRNVVFIEVKTGASALTKRERLVRDAIRAGRVKWVEWNAERELRQANSAMFE